MLLSDKADLLPTISRKRCIQDFNKLSNAMGLNANGQKSKPQNMRLSAYSDVIKTGLDKIDDLPISCGTGSTLVLPVQQPPKPVAPKTEDPPPWREIIQELRQNHGEQMRQREAF